VSGMLDVQDVLRRLCALQREVCDAIGYDEPADCFCRQGGFWKMKDYGDTYAKGYRNAGRALAFIEAAVRAALRHNPAPVPPAPTPGWAQRQIENSNRNVREWPEWMRRAAGLAAPTVHAMTSDPPHDSIVADWLLRWGGRVSTLNPEAFLDLMARIDAAVAAARAQGKAEMATAALALPRYNCDCLPSGPDGHPSDEPDSIYTERDVILLEDLKHLAAGPPCA